MKNIIVLILTCFSMFSFAQPENNEYRSIRGYVGLKENFQLSKSLLISSELKFGVSIPFKRSCIAVFTVYQLEGNIGLKDGYIQYPNIIRYVPSYYMQNHFLGLGIQYRFRAEEKIYSPAISISFMKEFFSNYRGHYIFTYSLESIYLQRPNNFIFRPSKKPATNLSYMSHGSSGNSTYGTYYYVSTPLKGSLYFENEFKLIENLRIDIGIFYSFRLIKMRYKLWGENIQEPISDISNFKLKEKNLGDKRVSFMQNVSVSLGLSYTFPFKKEPKTLTP